jgi:hypothetical protein
VPLPASNSAVAAYLRLTGNHAVLVVANLGAAPVSSVWLGSASGVLPPGRYQPRNLLGGPDGAVLEVGQDGQMEGYLPIPGPLGSRESVVLNLIRR